MLIGAALFGGGIYAYFRQRARIAQSLPAEGVVIEQDLGEFTRWARCWRDTRRVEGGPALLEKG